MTFKMANWQYDFHTQLVGQQESYFILIAEYLMKVSN